MSFFPPKQGLYDPNNEKDSCGVALIANLNAHPEHQIVLDAQKALCRMDHRGASGSEETTGDGVGILTGLPHKFFQKVSEREFGQKVIPGRYAVGNVFLPKDEQIQLRIKNISNKIALKYNVKVMGWRKVPIGKVEIGSSSKKGEPHIEQIFLQYESPIDTETFNRKLYLIKKRILSESKITELHFCSLSCKTIVYKGQLTCFQFPEYFQDLNDPDFESHFALVHSRFSTNTFPSWKRSQPNSYTCHNGEINTLRGNKNWMTARQGQLKSSLFEDPIESVFPIIDEDASDSGVFDSILELLVLSGRSLPEAIVMMIPEAWQNNSLMNEKKRAFYQFFSSIMEPWDGPATFVLTDGDQAGAILDRNGLRPSRYYITTDHKVILGSEVGIIDIPIEKILKKGRLKPGKLFLIDFKQKRIIKDKEIKSLLADKNPYQEWIQKHSVLLEDLSSSSSSSSSYDESPSSQDPRLKMFNYSIEHLHMLLEPLGMTGMESLGSMGNDEVLAVRGNTNRQIYDYFKQLFAQVTNPPIDPIREGIVMSLACYIGPEGNPLETFESQVHRIYVEHPILSLQQVNSIRQLNWNGWKTKEIDICYPSSQGSSGFVKAIDRICLEASKAVEEGYSFILLSDRKTSSSHIPVSSLMACGSVHHHLISKAQRGKIGMIIETGEAREVHHHCVLFGFGADAICPYLVYDIFAKLIKEGHCHEKKIDTLIENYRKGCEKGILKVMAKMGISTLQSYKGAQVFEAVGLNEDIVEKCFRKVASRIRGVGFDFFARQTLTLHQMAYPQDPFQKLVSLGNHGNYHWRVGGSEHFHSPDSIAKLQEASRLNSRDAFDKYCEIADAQTKKCTIRGMLKLKTLNCSSIPIHEVEPVTSIVKQFVTGAMSYGSISKETHETLAVAMNQLGGKSNTGEGGEDPERFLPDENGLSKKSAIKQVASARFGVTIHYLSNAEELQIKMAQGAKPGEGGELPGDKVSESIAKTRCSTPGVGLISPPPHHDIYSIEDLKQLIHDLKNANRNARVSVKLVSEVGVGVIAAGVAKGKADHILISGHEGGTGASRWTGIKHAGLPWELGLAETHQTLVLNDLRGRVVLQTDGGIRTPLDVIYATLLGAEEFGFGTIPLITLGCIMMRKCHLNTCPVGIATQDPELRKKFEGKPEHLINFFFLLAEKVREYLALLGFRTLKEAVGRTDLLTLDDEVDRNGVDLSPLLKPAFEMRPGVHVTCQQLQDHKLDQVLDFELLEKLSQSIQTKISTSIQIPIRNINRTVGTILSNEISKLYGEEGLPDETIKIQFEGSAGQSFGAFLAHGVTLELIGDANDYVGKGLSGGRIIVYPPSKSSFPAEKNIIIGNVALFGATRGEAFIRGIAAERFCVRNSGATAVVEGVGDHGCEYMTGGRVIVLGKTGRNFAAGMSGGIAYVWDPINQFKDRCNMEMVVFETLDEEDKDFLFKVISKHSKVTGSTRATSILQNWKENLFFFKKVMPIDYRKVLQKMKEQTKTQEEEVKKMKKAIQIQEMKIQDIEEVIPKGLQAKIVGFKTYKRKSEDYRDEKKRMFDFDEIYTSHPEGERTKQASRCMDCGVPFCQSGTGCPIGNLIPEWNALVYAGKWKDAFHRLLQTNNFPEFTGRVCPAPCEGSCTLGISEGPVTIKNIENSIINRAWEEGWMIPNPPPLRRNKKIAIVGSGPAGLSAADQLNKLGYQVTVYERADRIGGLLVYGIPNMKLDKKIVLQRRLDLMEKEGVQFITNANIGVNMDVKQLVTCHDATLLACGSTVPRDLPIPGRQLKGIHFAMDFLTGVTKSLLDSNLEDQNFISPKGKRVLVIGGGDTGNDCLGSCMRLGCSSIINFEVMPQPSDTRSIDNPWPQWPKIMRVDYGHSEAKEKFSNDPREYSILSKSFVGDKDGNVTGINTVRVKWTNSNGRWEMKEVPGTEKVWKCDLVLLSMGFLGPEKILVESLGLETDSRSNIKADYGKFQTSIPTVFSAGDCRRGQSLVVRK